MTFLELCKRVRADAGISGDIATVLNQQGMMAKLVNWVRQADLDIQRMQTSWTFMWRTATPLLQVGVRLYQPADLDIQQVRDSLSFQIGKQYLKMVSWEHWMQSYNLQLVDTPAQPTVFTQRPDGAFLFDRIPDQAYPLTIAYYIKPISMVSNSSVSVVPEEYHEAIVQRALYLYAKQEEDQYLMQTAQTEFDMLTSQLAADYLPDCDFDRGRIY